MKGCVAWLLLAATLAGVADSQYAGSGSANKLELERMKLLSGGLGPLTSPKPPVQEDASPYKEIVYSEPSLDTSYKSDSSWNPRGMGQLYTLTSYFLSLILQKEAFPPGMIEVRKGHIKFGDVNDNWEEWVHFYAGPIAVVAIGLALLIILPIAGLFFCCCRCVGRCGARSKLEKRHDPCKRGLIATLLLAVAVLILFGVVCAFVTNEQMKEGTDNLIDSAKVSLKDTQLYLKNTKIEVDTLLISNYKQLKDQLNMLTADAGEIVKDQLANASHAAVLSSLSDIVGNLDVIRKDLEEIGVTTRMVQENTTLLGEFLDQTREELLRALHQCKNDRVCMELMQLPQIKELRVVQNFTQLMDKYLPKLPDLKAVFDSIQKLVGSGSLDSIYQQVIEGQRSLNSVQEGIMRAVAEQKPVMSQSLDTAGEKLEHAATEIKTSINEISNLLNHLAGTNLDQADFYIDEYAIYRYYIGLAICCVLLLILLFISFGLMCGICGKRPQDLYSDDGDWCSTVAGSKFLIFGVWLIFMFFSSLMALILIHFLIGSALTSFVCRPLSDPTHDKVFTSFVDRYVSLESIYRNKEVDITLSEAISVCHQNKSIYTTLKLENVMNIDEIMNYNTMKELDYQIKMLVGRVNVRTDRVMLLSPSARSRIEELIQSPLNNIQFGRYTELLNGALTNINLHELALKLKDYADQIPDRDSSTQYTTDIRRLLRTKAQFLQLLQNDQVVRVQNGVSQLQGNVRSLMQHLKVNNTSLKEAVQGLLFELDDAQRFLVYNGSAYLTSMVDNFSKEYMSYIDHYLHRVVNKTKTDIGRCGVVSNVYNATRVGGCNRLVDPLNGFWASVGWCLILFIVALVLSIKLSSLYQNSDAYTAPGIYPESEYLYDAYADRDNIPLAVTHGDKKQNHHRSYQETYDNNPSGNYHHDYTAHLGRSDRSAGSAGDMAPKHWDSRGPPRYQQTPGPEYERPPPYYFPGPGERS